MFTLKKCLPGGCHVVTKHIFTGRKAGLRHNERVWTGASNIPVLHQVWKEKKTLKPTENLANLTIVCLHHSTLFWFFL